MLSLDKIVVYCRKTLEVYEARFSLSMRPLLKFETCETFAKHLSKVTLGVRSFTYAAPNLWNGLPLAIRSVNTVTGFNGKRKVYLFSKAF